MNEPGNISKAILGENIGTRIINKEEWFECLKQFY
jgi:hypothetical protein